MTKVPDAANGATTLGNGPKKAERRDNRRVKLAQEALIRPSGYEKNDFSEVLTTVNVSRHGIYVQTERKEYVVGMRLFVTTPYSTDPTSLRVDYLAKVARILELPDGRRGIGIQLISVIKFKSR